jgi:GT2 family glycosyltransferase
MDAPTAGPVRVMVLLTVVEGSDLEAALAVVGRQVYQPKPEVVIVGEWAGSVDGVGRFDSLEAAIASAGEDVDYLWILHSDARPRPDALAALVRESDRHDASLAGSKLLVAGSRDVLEEVGSATDVFGEPYSGLEEGEIDLQQYDVVREVAFVRSASLLVRRDLAQGLRGLDDRLPPVAAGLDFSQRARLAGGSVISVPSSEVYHQARCNEGLGGWREQAGRLRAMLVAYKPLTLAWFIPYDILVSVVDSLANLLLLRWRPMARHLLSWLWNLAHLPSTISRRRRLNRVRVSGDEELFRFQARGSVRLREVGSEIVARVMTVFDDDERLATRSRLLLAAPGIWGGVVAVGIALVSARSLVFSGVPGAGFSFPFEAPVTLLDRWLGGWNGSGLGSPAAVHPSALPIGIAGLLAFGATGFARATLTILLAVVGIVGMGRLGGRLGLRGPGRYLAGLVLMAGPGTALAVGLGSWLSLAGAAFLPWAVRAVLALSSSGWIWGQAGWAVVVGVVVASFSPLLVVVPLTMVLLYPVAGLQKRRFLLGLACLSSGVVALPFLLGDPGWLVDPSRRLALAPAQMWVILLGAAFASLMMLQRPWMRIGTLGVILALSSIVALHLPFGGPGVEEATLIVASFGAALATAAGLDRLQVDIRRLIAVAVAAAMLVLSIGTFGNGRYGLPEGDVSQRIGFASALAGQHGPGRILLASTVRSDIPGEARAGPGFWYRVVDGKGMTQDQAWLPAAREGDDALAEALRTIAAGSTLRPGEVLAPFAVEWVVLSGPEFSLDQAMSTQLDLVRTPLDPRTRVFDNSADAPLAAGSGVTWGREGPGFSGDTVAGLVRLAVNHDPGWSPAGTPDGWAVAIDGRAGRATYRGTPLALVSSALGGVALIAGLVLMGIGRAKR